MPWPAAEMALHHHGVFDGSGYPDGIKVTIWAKRSGF